MTRIVPETLGEYTAPKTIQDFRSWMPGFFNRSNRRFFRDQQYRLWKGYLLVVSRYGRENMSGVAIYRPYINESKERDFFLVDHARDVEDARIQINVEALKHEHILTEMGLDK